MKKIAIILFAWALASHAQAQTIAELLTTSKYSSHEIWWNKSFSDSSRFSFFSYTRFRVDYKNAQGNEFLSYSTLNYDLTKGLGVSVGGFITNHGFSPVVALNYSFINDTWFVNLFPSIEVKQKPNVEIFAFVQFRPKLTPKLRLFTQLIANSNFNFRQHNFSEQTFRLGLDYRTFQFGFGADIEQITLIKDAGVQTQTSNALGIFVRKEF